MKKDKLSFPNQLSTLEQRLRDQLDEETFKQVARIILRLEPVPEDAPIFGLKKIAEFTGYTVNQIAKWSPALQELKVLRRITKHDGNQRRPIVMAYKSHLRQFFQNFSPSMKQTLKEMRRRARYHDCPKCGHRIWRK